MQYQDHAYHSVKNALACGLDFTSRYHPNALAVNLCRALAVPSESIHTARPSQAHVVATLLPVKLWNWFVKEFEADVVISGTMEVASFAAVGNIKRTLKRRDE